MAGSDLDGDQYFVTWLPSLLKDFRKKNCEPMDFPPPIKKTLGRDVKVSDVKEFIVVYIQNDRLGQIANAHKAHADEESIFSPICQTLAKKHSEAVDFPKTGHCPELEKDERVKKYPDFMGKHGQNIVRRSDKALGHLFRQSRKIANIIPQNDVPLTGGRLCEMNKRLAENFDQKHVDDANIHLERYRIKIQGLMNRFGIESEAEMLSGCIRRLHLRLSQRDEKHEVVQVVNKLVKALRQTYRAFFFQEFGGVKQLDLSDCEQQKKAATWYKVAYSSEEKVGRSLPWVVWDLLSKQCGSADVGNPVCEAISDTMPDPDVLKCINMWTKHANVDPLSGLYRIFCSEHIEKYGNGTVLVNFLKWAVLQKKYHLEIQERDHFEIQIDCLRAFFSLVCTADFKSLVGRHSDHQGELSLIVPTESWRRMKQLKEYIGSKFRIKYGSDITINIRPHKKGRYPTGKIFLRAKHNKLDEMESAFNRYFQGEELDKILG